MLSMEDNEHIANIPDTLLTKAQRLVQATPATIGGRFDYDTYAHLLGELNLLVTEHLREGATSFTVRKINPIDPTADKIRADFLKIVDKVEVVSMTDDTDVVASGLQLRYGFAGGQQLQECYYMYCHWGD